MQKESICKACTQEAIFLNLESFGQIAWPHLWKTFGQFLPATLAKAFKTETEYNSFTTFPASKTTEKKSSNNTTP